MLLSTPIWLQTAIRRLLKAFSLSSTHLHSTLLSMVFLTRVFVCVMVCYSFWFKQLCIVCIFGLLPCLLCSPHPRISVLFSSIFALLFRCIPHTSLASLVHHYFFLGISLPPSLYTRSLDLILLFDRPFDYISFIHLPNSLSSFTLPHSKPLRLRSHTHLPPHRASSSKLTSSS